MLAPQSAALAAFTAELKNRTLLVLSGAGISTESGIPDYRGPESLQRNIQPMTYQQFAAGEAARQRYWARSFLGWDAVRKAEPNEAHHAVARLEAAGHVTGVITQNVDGLHQAAGSKNLVELHGSLSAVRCLNCKTALPRTELQETLRSLNPGFSSAGATLKPDGDSDLTPGQAAAFTVAPCPVCGGVLKPDVVFFGENIPRPTLERAWALFEATDVLLVLGSSLTVPSGYRFAERAQREGKLLAIINRGLTRADAIATVRLDGPLGELLPAVERQLASS